MHRIQLRKLNIIKLEMGVEVEDNRLLASLEKEAIRYTESVEQKPNVWEALRPVHKVLSLEQMIAAQGTQPIDRDTFFSLAAEVGLDEPIKELLADLTA